MAKRGKNTMENVVGLDLGTMNIVSAKQSRNNTLEVKNARNMFVSVDTTTISLSEIENTDLEYLVQKDGDEEKIFIISEDSLKFSQIFGFNPQRPMSKGVISQGEIDSIDVMTMIIKKLIGSCENKDGYCVYSVPATPVDNPNVKVLYHEKVFSRVLDSLGYKSKALNEAMGVIFSNCGAEKFSGIGISWGCGMTNCATSYRGINAFDFSIARGGDWIDEQVALATNTPVSRITGIKERKFNLLNPKKEAKNKKEEQILEALSFYYRDLIEYVVKTFNKEFEKNSDGLDIEDAIPIVISGGTSRPEGFIDVFKELFESNSSFPYEISEIRSAKDPMSAVAEGNLTYAMWEKKKEEKSKES